MLLNFSREKELIWTQQWRASTAIYFFLRYPVIAFQIFNVYISGYSTQQVSIQYYRQKTSAENSAVRSAIVQYPLINVPMTAYSCNALYKFTWALSIILTRIAITGKFKLVISLVVLTSCLLQLHLHCACTRSWDLVGKASFWP